MFFLEIRPVRVGAEELVVNPKIFEKLVCVCDVIEYAASPVTV